MTDRFIRWEDRDGIRSIAIDRAEKANALTAGMMFALADAVRTACDTKLVLIEGRGPAGFCAGADIAEFLQGGDYLERQEEGLKAMVASLATSPRPVIAAIHGRTLGAGVLIASLCDLVIAADNLAFGLPEIRFNMYPVIVQAALEEKVSEAVAFQLCATGRLLDAVEARSLGLASDIVPAASFAAGVAERAEFYRDRIEALQIGRRAKARREGSDVQARIARLAPLMHENFNRPGVRETIARYLKAR
ncbi:enoyl-CoA hydratase/isomerase family protein [Nitrobacteraceae bacterium UC4446_H13]